ncbi:hypothetical protein As57867_008023, partial [Aphanomyces stellatus]
LNPDATFDWKHPFALMTESEFKTYVKVSFNQGSQPFVNTTAVANVGASVASVVDWTTKCNPPVRNQGSCGSCWAHAAVGVAEAAHCLATGQLLSLSVQQVTSCSTEGGSQGCNGGFPWYAIDYATQGLCLDSEWPYAGQTGPCSRHCNKQRLSIGESIQVSGEGGTISALNNQPVSATVEAGNYVWKNYQGGVVSQCPGGQSDHAVIAVGYDDQSIKIKNSWGTGWGEGGYMRLRRGVGGQGTCNVVGAVAYPRLSTKPNPQPSPSPVNPTPGPQPSCGNCNACYYPGGDSCLAEFTQYDCDYYSATYGTVWCGGNY